MRRTILLVDDDPDVRFLLKAIAELEGCEVRTAGNGAEALALLTAGYVPDLILSDLMMPIMDGRTFSREVRRLTWLRAVPIVVMSAAGDLVNRLADLPIQGWIAKPFDTDQLHGWLGQMAHAENPVRASA